MARWEGVKKSDDLADVICACPLSLHLLWDPALLDAVQQRLRDEGEAAPLHLPRPLPGRLRRTLDLDEGRRPG